MTTTVAPSNVIQEFLGSSAPPLTPGRALVREVSRMADLAKMTQGQTNELVKIARGDDEALASDAKDLLVRRLLPVVGRAIAKLDIKCPSDREDARQAGMLRTLSCIEHFDPAAGMSLPTYAYGSARGAALNWLQRERGDLAGSSESGRERSPARSLDTPARRLVDDDDVIDLADVLADEKSDDPAECAVQSIQSDALRREVDLLPPREREVMILCFGLDGAPPRTKVAVGEMLGVSSTRVGVIAAGALEMLRDDSALERLGRPEAIHDKPPRSPDELATAALKDHRQAASPSILLSNSIERTIEEERHRHQAHVADLEALHPEGLSSHLEQILSDRATAIREASTTRLKAGAAAHRAAAMAMTMGAS